MSNKIELVTASDPFAALSDEEVRVLPPDHALKKIIGEDVDIKQVFSVENVEKAQAVINEHKDSFMEWVLKDLEQLKNAYTQLKNSKEPEPDIRKLAKMAFIIKSQAGTFGFGLGTQVAKSLDDFCNSHLHPNADQMRVIEKHIETLSIIFSKNISGTGGDVGKELSNSLFKLVDKFRN